MEDVLDTYKLPYDPLYPVVCMDETCKQLVGEVIHELPARCGAKRKVDDEYVRNGVAEIFLSIEPLTGRCHTSVGEHRGMAEWADFIDNLLTVQYPEARKIRLVMDNLNTHRIASLYQRFPADKARKLAERLEIHYTPKHGSWLDVAEIGLSMMCTQCLDKRRIPTLAKMSEAIGEWEKSHNQTPRKIIWQFTKEEARIKLVSIYPKF